MQHSKAFKYLVLPFVALLIHTVVFAQQPDSNNVTSVQADMVNIFTQKPKKYKIVSLKTTGNHYFDENLLISISSLNVGDEVTIPGGDNFARAINKLWAQSYFSNVEIYITKLEGTDISIEIAVTERPRLGRFEFENISKSDKDDLKAKVGLIAGHIVTENSIRTAKEAIRKFYAEKSYYNVNVVARPEKDSTLGNAVLLVFDIDKGNKVRVENITFSGNTIEETTLKKQLKDTKEKSRFTLYPPVDTGIFASSKKYTFDDYLKERGYLTATLSLKVLNPYFRFHFFNSSKFNQTKFNEDQEKLIDYYNSIGYRDAAIVGKPDQVPNMAGNLNIHIKVTEGKQYRFGNITWKGNTKYPDSLLTLIMNIKKGDIYNQELLNKRLGKGGAPDGNDVSSLYMDDGYLFFHTEVTETAVYNDTIDFQIKLTEGPQAVWKNVKIVGNDKTKEYVIRRELRTLPGEKFSRTDLMRSQRELAQLNYFNQEKIVPQVVPNPDDGTVDVTWQLEEKSSDQLELSAGWGGNIGLTGTLGVSFNNFSAKNLLKRKAWDPLPMGDGQKLSLRFQSNGTAFRSYNFSFTEPWLGGRKRNSLTYSIYDTKYSNSYNPITGLVTNSGSPSYIRTTGTSLSIGRQLKWPDDYFSMSVGLNYTLYTLKDYYIDRTNLPGFNNGSSNNLNLKVAVQRSSINNPQFPASGSSFMLSLQLTPPYSSFNSDVAKHSNPYNWIEYHKWRFNGELYVPLTNPVGDDHKQLVMKFAAKYGFLGRFNSTLQVSPFERFQVGDAGLSNQFALLGYDIIAQRGYPVYQSSNPTVNPDQSSATQYFTMFNKYVMELRYPLSLSAGSTIYGLGFFEAANGWYGIKDYNPFKLRRSVGVGMRFYLPMFGLLGFDYGLGLDRYTPGSSLKDISRFTFMLGFEPE